MEFNIRNRKIVPVQTDKRETAWAIEDALLVFEYLRSIAAIVLGGDVLNEDKECTYDNWFYNPSDDCSDKVNSEKSIKHAVKYISDYIKKNGKNFYVVIVTK